VYATCVSILALLRKLDKRLAWGPPRKLNWDEEVVVITGGAGGLGKVLAETYGMRGVSVAVLDIREPGEQSEALENVRFYECDVSRIEDVQKAKLAIEQDVRSKINYLPHRHFRYFSPPKKKEKLTLHPSQLGPCTILINNAGTVSGAPLLSLSPSQITTTLQTNLHSHFHTLQTFLPSLLASPSGGGTIVTVASVLGRLGAAHLTDYAAAKAGLIALHASLRAELTAKNAPPGAENVRMVLVTPGQLGTRLFEGVKTPSSFLGPVVEAVELAREIVRIVDEGVSGEVSLPLYAKWVGVLQVLPWSLQRVARWASGVDGAMSGFRGGGKKEA
jgi:NAD(P)-dependent dehydrogenase (short-subunit alcohol dehydrogenase family)